MLVYQRVYVCVCVLKLPHTVKQHFHVLGGTTLYRIGKRTENIVAHIPLSPLITCLVLNPMLGVNACKCSISGQRLTKFINIRG